VICEHYEQVRAYDTVLDGASLLTLHALRIAFKRLRYTVESFEEVLGPEAKLVIKEIRGMQDHLGDLNDTRVVGDALRQFVDQHNAEYSGVPVFLRPDISGVAKYARARETEQQRLLATFPAAWANFNRDDVRRALALAVAAL
jgi:CHAD domain-containing protein